MLVEHRPSTQQTEQRVKAFNGLVPAVPVMQASRAGQGALADAVPLVARIADDADALVLERFGLDERWYPSACFLERTGHGRVVRQVSQAHDLRRRKLDLPMPVLAQRLVRRQPDALGGFTVVVARNLAVRHASQEETGVEPLA